jgi:uncharacterized phage protein (TIGR02220 family)
MNKIPNIPIQLKSGMLSIYQEKVISLKKVVKPKKEKETKKAESEINMNEVYESIISYLNQKAGTGYKSETNSYRTFINARLKSGYKIEDFYKVIDNKSNEWIGTDFQKFLRPETLFGNKFDSYLNQNVTKKTNQECNDNLKPRVSNKRFFVFLDLNISPINLLNFPILSTETSKLLPLIFIFINL